MTRIAATAPPKPVAHNDAAGPADRPDRTVPGRLDPATLRSWYRAAARDLPWRRPDAGPWAVLVSEIMLQQTPVARVLPAYRRWLARWPTPADLAAASPADVLREWGTLGYPRRALRLQAAAAAIVTEHAGLVPGDVAALLALPGIGEYTARAVAAFGFGAREPVVDTNVRRVLSRAVRGVDQAGPATAADRAQLAGLLPAKPAAAAAFSVAVMELGALVCTAARPTCERCPIAAGCAWLTLGRPAGPPRPAAQRWHGTDRQVRGRIMARLRAATGPLAEAQLVEPTDAAGIRVGEVDLQWRRCLDSLLTDGLAIRPEPGWVTLPQ